MSGRTDWGVLEDVLTKPTTFAVIYKDRHGSDVWQRFQSNIVDQVTAETIARALDEANVHP